MLRQDLDESRTPEVLSETASNPSTPTSPLISVCSNTSNVEAPVPTVAPAVVQSTASSLILKLFCGTVDFVRIAAVTQALLSRWLHQLFLELERYDSAPSQKVQKTWLGYSIMGASALLAILAKTLNAVAKSEKYLAAEDYLFTIFCSSLFYFCMDLVAGAQSMPLGTFIATSAVAIPLSGAFFLNLMLPDSDNRFYLRAADLNYITALRYDSGMWVDRIFNTIAGIKHGAESLMIMCWMVNREVNGKTVALPGWQMGLIGAGVLASAKMGYDLTDHPIRFQQFMMLSKFLQDGALGYAAFSGIFYMLFSEKSFFEDAGFKAMSIVACSFLAACVGVYAATTTRFRFEENVEGIERVVKGVQCVKESVKDCVVSVGDGMSRFFASCCKKQEDAVAVERTDSLNRALV